MLKKLIGVPLLWLKSFYARSLYQQVAHTWRGFGFIYLLLLLAVCQLPNAYQSGQAIRQTIDEDFAIWLPQVPTFKIINGEVSIDKPMPYLIVDPTSKKTVAIIDTTGRYTTLAHTAAEVLVTRNKLFIREEPDVEGAPATEINSYDLSDTEKLVITPAQVKQTFALLKVGLPILAYFGFLCAFLAYYLLQTLVYAALGLLMCKVWKTTLSYAQLYRLAVVALTPTLIISTVLASFNTTLQYQWIFYQLISLIYLGYAVYANLPSKKSEYDQTRIGH